MTSQKMTGSKQNTLHIILLLLIILPLIVISFFNHPLGDDYWFSSLVRKDGFAEAYSNIRQTVSARYTALSLMAVNPLIFENFFLYKIIPIAFIIVFFLTCAHLLKTLNNQHHYLLSGTFTAIYFAVMPGIGEGLYWTSSLCGYQCGIIFLMLWAATVIKWYVHNNKNFITGAIACFCLLATAGCNEILAVLMFFGSLLIVIYPKKKDLFSVLMLLLSFGCVLYVLTAKSFTDRYQPSFKTADIFSSAYLGAQYMIYHMLKCLANPFFWVGLLLAGKIKFHLSLKKAFIPWLALMFFIEFIAAHLSVNHVVPLRVTNMMVFFFLFGMFCLLSLHNLRYKYFLVGILLIAGSVTKNNILTATRELLNGDAAAYNEELNNRYQVIRECKSDTCTIPQLQHRPTTLRYSSFDNDEHIGEYFNKVIRYE